MYKKSTNFILSLFDVLAFSFVILLSSCTQFENTSAFETQTETEDNILYFDDASTFVKMLNYSNEVNSDTKISDLARTAINSNFVSMIDVIPSIDNLQTESDFNDFISKYPEILNEADYTTSKGELVSVYNLAISPQLASLVNPDASCKYELFLSL